LPTGYVAEELKFHVLLGPFICLRLQNLFVGVFSDVFLLSEGLWLHLIGNLSLQFFLLSDQHLHEGKMRTCVEISCQ